MYLGEEVPRAELNSKLRSVLHPDEDEDLLHSEGESSESEYEEAPEQEDANDEDDEDDEDDDDN